MNAATTNQPGDVTGNLRQMIAVLEEERQALASLDSDALTCSTHAKEALCDALMPIGPGELSAEARALAQTAQQLNEVNRRVRNLLAANVAARLEALGGTPATYTPAHFASA
ncbi:flagellar protein FlgN [uncultured Erythrobacter sp.]|uniref:flagellar protein FlgN n=1 Tax=uncultured Erythrobacter sp. TaxID=263913 RepID=UPI002616AC9D|nr:flagellar protein FlgN [uncultured Erythrobacter sp.]